MFDTFTIVPLGFSTPAESPKSVLESEQKTASATPAESPKSVCESAATPAESLGPASPKASLKLKVGEQNKNSGPKTAVPKQAEKRPKDDGHEGRGKRRHDKDDDKRRHDKMPQIKLRQKVFRTVMDSDGQ